MKIAILFWEVSCTGLYQRSTSELRPAPPKLVKSLCLCRWILKTAEYTYLAPHMHSEHWTKINFFHGTKYASVDLHNVDSGITKVVVCAILSVKWCISKYIAANRKG